MSTTQKQATDGPRERSIDRMENAIEEIQDIVDSDSSLVPIGIQIYRQIYKNNLYHGQNFDEMTGAISYLASLALEENPSPVEFSRAAGVEKEDLLDTSRSFRKSISGIEFGPVDPKAHLKPFCQELEVDEEVASLADEIADEVISQSEHSGKRPTTFAASIIYAASRLSDSKVTQSEISDVSEVSEVSIRNHYRDFIDTYKDAQ